MINFTNAERLGAIPTFFWESDLRPAKEQIAERYAHGGGYSICSGEWEISVPTTFSAVLTYLLPGDEADERFREWGRGALRDETIIVFDAAFTAIVQPDGSFDVIRMD